MNTIGFSINTFAVYIITSIVLLLMAATIAILWRTKTHAPIKTMVIGAVTFLLFALVIEQPIKALVLMTDNPFARAVSGNLWFSALVGGLFPGIFEEGGRFIAFKSVLRKETDRQTAITYGVGHGGVEIIFTAFLVLSYVVMGIMVNNGMTEQLLGNAEGAARDAAIAQIQSIAQADAANIFWSFFERCSAFTIHVSLSVMVFKAARAENAGSFMLLPLAVVLHAIADGSIVLLNAFNAGIPVIECSFAVIAAISAAAAFMIYKNMEKTEKTDI